MTFFHLLFCIQRDALESETAELDVRQQQLDARLVKLNKQVTDVLFDMLSYVCCHVGLSML